MKKIIAFCLILSTMFIFASCVTPTQSENDVVAVKDIDEKYSIKALCEELLENEYIDSNGVDMAESTIGAEVGYRYNSTVEGATFNVEIYEYDTENLNEAAQKIINEIEEKGSFLMLEYKEVPAVMSESGEFMIIYNDPEISKEEQKEAHSKRYEQFMEIVNSQ